MLGQRKEKSIIPNPTTALYKHPGKKKLHGDMFDTCFVDSALVNEYLKEGWALTSTEAKAIFLSKKELKIANSKKTEDKLEEDQEWKSDNVENDIEIVEKDMVPIAKKQKGRPSKKD